MTHPLALPSTLTPSFSRDSTPVETAAARPAASASPSASAEPDTSVLYADLAVAAGADGLQGALQQAVAWTGSANPVETFVSVAQVWDGAIDLGEAVGGVSSQLRLYELIGADPNADALRPLSSDERISQAVRGTKTVGAELFEAIPSPAGAALAAIIRSL